MQPINVVIEDWDGDGGIRIPDEALQELGIDVGDTLYLIETVVGTGAGFVLSKTPTLPDRLDELLAQLEPGSTNR
jgi:antitoxin component of MazEF toxin-antitoxin module